MGKLSIQEQLETVSKMLKQHKDLHSPLELKKKTLLIQLEIENTATKGLLIDFIKRTFFITFLSATIATILLITSADKISTLIFGSQQFKTCIVIASLSVLPFVLYQNLYDTFSGLRVFKLQSLIQLVWVTLFSIFGILLTFYLLINY